MNKNIWIIANWKSNKNIKESLEWVDQVAPKISRDPNLKVVVCPQFDCIEEVKKSVQVGDFPLMVGAQDLSPYNEGAFTGEESAKNLSDYINLVILGHSERRKNFGETDQMVAEKVDQAVKNNITPLVCVQSEETAVPSQCKLIAYEPVWAIGTGNPDTPDNANKVAGILKEKHPGIDVLYGGSVDHQNANSFIEKENISGLLIGKSSLEAAEFLAILESVKN